MICISVTPESRQLAKVDLLNASRHCDLIELCLDKLIKPPEVAEMIDGISKPILVSCRRKQDGGHWNGSDSDRLQLLRNAIVAGPAYVELDIETAREIPRFGDTKRVISHTSLDRPLTDVEQVFEDAVQAKADVVKFTWPTPTLEDAWPLLVAVSKKRNLPTVGIGLGRSGLTFSLLGQRYGSPWVYAALEKGMEAYPNQPTVWELHDIYGIDGIETGTRFVGVTGIGRTEPQFIQAINTAFQSVGANLRCLPLTLKSVERLEKMLGILKVQAMIIGPHEGSRIRPFAAHVEPSAEKTGYTDLLLNQSNGWNGYNTAARAVIQAVESALAGDAEGEERPLDRRNIMLIGSGGLSQAIAYAIHARKGVLSITSPDDKEAQTAAESLGARFVPFANVYNTLADVVIVTAPNIGIGHRKDDFNPSYFRPSMTVLDLSRYPGPSPLKGEAELRGARTIDPVLIVLQQLRVQFKAITGKDLPTEQVLAILEAIPA